MSAFLSDVVPDLPDTDPQVSTSNVALTAFFLRSIVTPRRLQTVTGAFEELPFFYLRTTGTEATLQPITLACATAAYGIRHDSASALATARSTYDVAIGQLSDDILAFSDCSAPGAVILSVFLCNFYEFMMCLKNNRPFRNIHERGLANDCLESGTSASEALGQAAAALDLADDDFCRLLTGCVIRAADAAAATSRLDSRSTKEQLLGGIERAQDIEKDLEQWTRCIPAHWMFSRHRDMSWPTEYAFNNRCDVYYDIQVAANWNCYRRARLTLLETIIGLIDLLSFSVRPDLMALKHTSLAGMEQISEDICASIPFHMGTRGSSSGPILFPDLNRSPSRNIVRLE
ncbi:hypothetical protein PRZ48_010262 [Zasmidium cellare]|uniref:Uncharacterized protein n=1 Tax=Zasmidium cellare TaxID=395010 RepID=A0ABR0E8F7_ZASCE|nr:hypothetical protein PRZ48_010262 [Zasmidium cellare]